MFSGSIASWILSPLYILYTLDLTNISLIVHRGTVEDTELVDGLVLDLKASHVAGGVTRVEKAKIGLIQFCISPPKTDVSKNMQHEIMNENKAVYQDSR